MLPGLSNIPSRAWLSCWEGFELDQLSRGLSPATIKTRRSTVLILARWATAFGYEPQDLDKTRMQRYLLAVYKGRKGISPVTTYVDLKLFWRFYSEEYGTQSPMDGIPRPKAAARPVHVLTPAEINEVLAACRKPRDLAVIRLMLSSGLRRSEVCRLDIEDVDVKSRTVTVKRGKGGKARVAVIDDDTAKEVWRMLRDRAAEPSSPLFLGQSGNRLTPDGLNQLVTRISARSGVPVHPHQLRHTWTSMVLSGGLGERDVMTLAGWSSPSMLGRYAAETAQQRAVEAGRQVQVSKVIKARK
jgi:integrase